MQVGDYTKFSVPRRSAAAKATITAGTKGSKGADLMARPGLTPQRAAVVLAAVMAATTVATAGQRLSTRPYFPPRGEWQKKDPAAVGLDKAGPQPADPVAGAADNP